MVAGGTGWQSRELVLGTEPDAVPKARRFAVAALPQLRGEVLDDVRLLVTELVTNAVIHARPPVTLRLSLSPGSIRIEVEDAGRGLPVQAAYSGQQMTGRGLSLISALSSAWGADPSPRGGKIVWADVPDAPGTNMDPVDPEMDPDAPISPLSADLEQVHEVRLGSVPTDLLLAAKRHIDNLVRQLTLAKAEETTSGISLPRQMSEMVRAVTADFADARTEIKVQAVAAAAKDQPLTELVLRLPLTAADAGERYLAALDEADRYARAARMLTLAAPESHQIFRRWYVQALVDQLRAAAQGLPVPPVKPFSLRR